VSSESEIAALIQRLALRDRAALAQLYNAVSPKLFGVCMRILRDRSDAEDALQEVFVKIWQRADRFSLAGTSPVGWMVAIARNHSIDRLRSRKPSGDSLDAAREIADTGRDPEAHTVLKSEGRRVDRCMGELEADRADAVRSAYVEGLSYQELAERYSVPLNTMRTWLRRSLLKLRECLDR
jgi:RNA polymerase sigma-70 factor (ECF subfamily)